MSKLKNIADDILAERYKTITIKGGRISGKTYNSIVAIGKILKAGKHNVLDIDSEIMKSHYKFITYKAILEENFGGEFEFSRINFTIKNKETGKKLMLVKIHEKSLLRAYIDDIFYFDRAELFTDFKMKELEEYLGKFNYIACFEKHYNSWFDKAEKIIEVSYEDNEFLIEEQKEYIEKMKKENFPEYERVFLGKIEKPFFRKEV